MKSKRNATADQVLKYIVLLVLAAVFVLPFVYMLSISLASPKTNSTAAFSLFPSEFYYRNYLELFQGTQIKTWFTNSLLLTSVNTVFTLLSSSLTAYAFARLRAPGKNILFMVLLSTMMMPTQVTLIPQFIIFRNLGWINTLLPLMIPNLFGVPFYVFLLRQFIMRLPNSLDEAAKIDGLGYPGVYARIIMPLITPALAAVSILVIVANWGWFFEPMIYLNETSKYPLAMGVQLLSNTGVVGATKLWNVTFAASMLLVVPMIVLYFVGQKYMFELNINTGSDSLK